MRSYTYVLGFIDQSSGVFDGIAKTYRTIDRLNSSIQEYIPMLRENFERRANWHPASLDHPFPDFCLSNFAKVQTASKVHYRLLLDTDTHFISNKGAFYDRFRDHDFIIPYCRMQRNTTIFAPEDWVIVKPDKGSLGLDIHVCRFSHVRDVSLNPAFDEWTVSRIHLAKRWNGYIVTNRVYFLAVKHADGYIRGYIYDEFVQYRAYEKFAGDDTDFAKNAFEKRLVSNFTPDGTTEADFYYDRFVSHENYVSMFSKAEFVAIFTKIRDALTTVCQVATPHWISANEWNPGAAAFHIYGVDVIVDDFRQVKIVEMNGAPTITDRWLRYPGTECMDYNDFMNALLHVVVDPLFPPVNTYTNPVQYGKYRDSTEPECLFSRTFVPIYETRHVDPRPLAFYISRQVDQKYPFIRRGFFNERRASLYRRIKNPHHPNIDVFCGLRDLYFHAFTEDAYYNEVAEYNKCVCARAARVLNRIQGVTYFLANKARLYHRLVAYLGHVPKYHPESVSIKVIPGKKACSKETVAACNRIRAFLHGKHTIIVKPTNGSQGKGIVVMDEPNTYSVWRQLLVIQKEWGYDAFLLSTYIANPCLYLGKKFNVRFYVLLFLENGILRAYLMNYQLVYYAMLEYEEAPLNTRFSTEDAAKMRNLTNLQIAVDMNRKYGLGKKMADSLDLFERMAFETPDLRNWVLEDFEKIARETICATRSEFRGLNRFQSNYANFNLIAYDTMLDADYQLHFIEVNRGADMVGLYTLLGEPTIQSIFEEMFDICVDGKTETFSHFREMDIHP
jgi:Tubulin-tyrosine ligase family